MAIRETRRKRRNSSISNLETPCSPASCSIKLRSKEASSHETTPQSRQASSCTTPQRQTKRVRFSDPGPQLQAGPDYSTGLTPALIRTSFEDPGDTEAITQTPSRRLRRRSTALPKTHCSHSPLFPNDGGADRVVQFTPLRQLLDLRTQRRIRRVGLSDEINQIEREKRETTSYQKRLQSLLQERDALKQELDAVKSTRDELESRLADDETTSMSPRARIEHLTFQNSRLREEISFSVEQPIDQRSVTDSDADTIMINDSGFEGDTILMSNSPDIRGLNERSSPVPDDLSLLNNPYSMADASTQAHLSDHKQDAEILALSLDLETARKEKRDLFEACRARLASFNNTALSNHLHHSSPPSDFLAQILPTLTTALSRASDAAQTLDSIKEKLSDLGFAGANVGEIISEMRHRFRSARLELERAVPGETANVALEDGSSTLSALVRRVELLVRNLDEEREHHDGSLGREKALRGQFDALLVRYEVASKKINDLEQSIASSASDMLHTRMRMQELEHEGKEQAIGIDRLNAALNKYRDEVKGLETLVTELEGEKAISNEKHCQQLLQLEEKVAREEQARCAAESTVAEQDIRIHELEETVKQNRVRACDLATKVDSLEKERQKAVDDFEQKTTEQRQHYENEMGFMNVRISELTTSLEEARSEAEKLCRSNAGLEEQLQLEIEARDNLLDKWAADQARAFAYMKETVSLERRKAKVRTANWELKSDDLQSDGVNLPSEPITPVSMARFVDVEVGRGKHRRRLDSGIGILTEDELLEEEDESSREISLDINLLPSDPANL